MTNTDSSPNIAIYGFGATGQVVADALIDQGHNLQIIIDKTKDGTTYRGVPVVSLAKIKEARSLEDLNCLVGLHNHYIDLHNVFQDLLELNFKNVYSLINANEIAPGINIPSIYWLDSSFDYERYASQFSLLKTLLADSKSIELLSQILKYRQFGNIADCPRPSLSDEYTPQDLPRYKGPLNIIDCGAFTGVAIKKFLSAGYEIDRIAGFEPDPINFEKLSSNRFNVKESLFLPLGAWSSNTQLRFANNNGMGSAIDEKGDTVIQCVRIDSVIKGMVPNLIKFDVEGAEIEALKGLEETIRSHKPNLCVSIYHTAAHLYEIPLLIQSWALGYKFYIRVHEFNTYGVVLYALRDDLVEKTN